jgi:hypothetical protein
MMIPYGENVSALVGIGVGRAVRTGREVGVTGSKADMDGLGV